MALSPAWLDFSNFIIENENPMKILKSTPKIASIIILIAFIAITISSCSSKKMVTAKEFAVMTQRIQDGTLRIAVDAAYPANTVATQQVLNSILVGTGDTANRVDLSGDGHFIVIGSDRVQASLPFYGERRQGGGYNNPQESGINFDVAPKDYTIDVMEDSYRYNINFEADASSGIDTFDVEAILFANGTAVIYVRSNTRTRIEYRGKVVEAAEQ
jgi:hypothetical protein